MYSQRLNDWILNRVKSINYFAYEGLPEMTFEEFKQDTKTRGAMAISADHCEGTIFGDAKVNIAFRAWHDELHLKLNEGFDYMEEARVAFAQCAELPEDWHYERMLIMAEVVGQAAYHHKTGNFVPDQIEFTNNLLNKGLCE